MEAKLNKEIIYEKCIPSYFLMSSGLFFFAVLYKYTVGGQSENKSVVSASADMSVYEGHERLEQIKEEKEKILARAKSQKLSIEQIQVIEATSNGCHWYSMAVITERSLS